MLRFETVRVPPWLIALVPVFPPLYLLAFGALRHWRTLPLGVRQGLFLFLASQALSAFFTERPLVSFLLAVLRGGFVVALITLGYQLERPRWLGYLLYGLLVVYLVAWATSGALLGERLLNGARLIHPYYTTVSIGLAGTLGLLLAAGAPGLPRWLRVLGGGLAFFTLLFSGSRGPLLALFVGAGAGVALGGRAYLRALATGVAGLALALLALEGGKKVGALTRLLNPAQLSGRDQVWAGAIEAIRSHPLGGAGTFQLGPYLNHLYRWGCHLWVGAEKLGLHCPGWLEPFYGAWLIAHNLFLHAFAENGLIGGVGWLYLYGLAALSAWRARDPLLAAIILGFLAMGLVDNPTLVPSLGLAEAFWVAVGMAIRHSAEAARPGA